MARKNSKSPMLYRVTIDYRAAGVGNRYPKDPTRIYNTMAGVGAYIRAALEAGVHPRFITVQEMPAAGVPAPAYDGLCPRCKQKFSEPNEECEQMRRIRYLNTRRHRLSPEIELPHPEVYVIAEVDTIEDVLCPVT